MKRILSHLLLAACAVLLLLPPQPTYAAPLTWQDIGSGVQYREFHLPGPNNVFVARMPRGNPGLALESSIGQGRLSGGAETVSGMARRYHQSINNWGEAWGGLSRVIVAINGYFFDTETGVPWRGQVQSGWYAKRFDDRQSGSGFAWKADRSAFVGACVIHRPDKQLITFLPGGQVLSFDGINLPRGQDQLILYTPHYDASTLTGPDGLEVEVELSRPALLLSLPEMVTGTIQAVHDGAGSTPLPFDHIVLSASGAAAAALRPLAVVGAQVGLSQEIRSYAEDCRTPLPLDWTRTYAGIGASFYFLKDGQVQPSNDLGAILRHPRTAIAYNDRYIFFIVVDGRDPYHSLGMSMVELAAFARGTLGAGWGVALDGGGSSTLVVHGLVRNNPNAELLRRQAYASLPAGPGESSFSLAPSPLPPVQPLDLSNPDRAPAPAERLERAVANGMLIVALEPPLLSQALAEGQAVTAAAQLQLRLGPGDNYAALADIPPGAAGVVTHDPHGINGVLAKGQFWWKIDFAGVAGWAPQDLLQHN